MNKFIEKIMRKFMPKVNMTCVQFTAESMEEAENIRDRLCAIGVLSKNRDNYIVWTGDGKIFTVEEGLPFDIEAEEEKITGMTMFPDDIDDNDDLYAEIPEEFIPEDFFDIEADEIVI